MRKNPLISIVVPIYNVERYLNRSINSILEQPFIDFELILVNDGSTDSSKRICEFFSGIDNRVIVINKNNGGPSSARNTGIEVARGIYIVFIDPDDQISEDFLVKLFNIAEQKQCDAVISGFKTIPNLKVVPPNFKLNTIMNGIDFVLSSPNIHSNNDLCFTWRNIFNLTLIKEKNIRFNEHVFIGEDVLFNLEFFLESKRIYAISDPLYIYTVNNPDSFMRAKYKPKLEGSLVLQYEKRKQLSEKYGLLYHKHYKKDMANYYINNIYKLMINNIKNSKRSDMKSDLSRIVNYPMITESLKDIGFTYSCHTIKEYIYYLALKFKIFPLLNREFM